MSPDDLGKDQCDQADYDQDDTDELDGDDIKRLIGGQQFTVRTVPEGRLSRKFTEERIDVDGIIKPPDTVRQYAAAGLGFVYLNRLDDISGEVLDIDLSEGLDVDITLVAEPCLDTQWA
jgi:hypothetical protein